MTTRDDFVAQVRTYRGTPYHHQGRLPGKGLDCAGVLIVPMLHFGLLPDGFDITGYKGQPDGTLRGLCEQHLTEIERDAMQPADVVLTAFGNNTPCHLGVIVPYWHAKALAMVHAETGKVVVETRLVFAPPLRFIAAYSIPGLT